MARLARIAGPPAALAVALVTLVVAGCASGSMTQRSLAPNEIPPALLGHPLAFAEIGQLELRVAVADTPGSRSRGLMGVSDFGGVDGMVFVYDAPTETSFHMKDVPVPLDIAFVGADGTVISVLAMAICPAEPCPSYRSPAPFVWALETPSGDLAGIAPGDRFSLGAD